MPESVRLAQRVVEVAGCSRDSEISLTHDRLPEYMAQAHVGGWTSTLDKLAARCEA